MGSQRKGKHCIGKSRGAPYFARPAAKLDNTELILLSCKTNFTAGPVPSLENFKYKEQRGQS